MHAFQSLYHFRACETSQFRAVAKSNEVIERYSRNEAIFLWIFNKTTRTWKTNHAC